MHQTERTPHSILFLNIIQQTSTSLLLDMSQRVVLNTAVKHIVDNLNIFGFGSEESALLQSVKELLENSLDACRSSMSLINPKIKRISVSIKEVDEMTCALEVSDDGSGVSDALSILKVFCSSKDGSNSNDSNPFATGRFGVGLSTCLVYSLDKCGTAMRMVTKCKEQDSATIADYSMDRTGQPQCVQNRSVNTEDFVSGTRIRVVLPLHNDRAATAQKGNVRFFSPSPFLILRDVSTIYVFIHCCAFLFVLCQCAVRWACTLYC